MKLFHLSTRLLGESVVIILLIGLVGKDKEFSTEQQDTSIQLPSVETLSFSFEPMKAFAESDLNHSVGFWRERYETINLIRL